MSRRVSSHKDFTLHPLYLKKSNICVVPYRRVHIARKQSNIRFSHNERMTVFIMLSSYGWLTASRRHPTCRCETTWQCLRWPDTFWWGWGEELAEGPLMCRAGETSGSLIHLSAPCSKHVSTLKNISKGDISKESQLIYEPYILTTGDVYVLVDADLLYLGN